ncbi:cysteine proteinase [Calocera cornea HHB12733]|uniref:Cysteine proteinase n=1 Tax=Calocera cornea HHB12733 TaxID=1353952 RepID=A0A166JF16_9BASI|nr:cysteine proteinase [Calocera cornea HHB12733]
MAIDHWVTPGVDGIHAPGEDHFSYPRWVLPILHNEHWTVTRIDWIDQRLLVFDSLHRGVNTDCLRLVQAIVESIFRFSAPQKPFPGATWKNWSVTPMFVPYQANSYDCGCWVMAQIFANLRGYDCTGLTTQTDIDRWRRYIYDLFVSLPEADIVN